MILSTILGATTDSLLISSSEKNLLETLIIPFLPTFLDTKLLPIVTGVLRDWSSNKFIT